jgi:hypothetical protein
MAVRNRPSSTKLITVMRVVLLIPSSNTDNIFKSMELYDARETWRQTEEG